MKSYTTCPICGDEKLHECKKNVMRELDGFKKMVPFHTSACDSCGSETLTDKQASFNKRQMADFYREADGLLTGSEIKHIRLKLGLSQVDAAKIFGGGSNAFPKYESGDVTQSYAMDNILRLAANQPTAYSFLCERAGFPVYKTKIYWPTKLIDEITISVESNRSSEKSQTWLQIGKKRHLTVQP